MTPYSFRQTIQRTLLIILVFAYPNFSKAQEKTLFQVMWWNVENLFDCKHDSLKNDYDFLPQSIRHWTYHRFTKKLNQIAQTIVAIGKWNTPAIIGLCEVENDIVLTHLTQYSSLKNLHYRYVMTHSEDKRGINIALLYQRDQFKLLQTQFIRIPPHKLRPTRDILHVSGLILSLDTLDIFLCHLPSRAGGGKETEKYRLEVANQLKQAVDSVLQQREHPNVIIMGDFNDDIKNKTLTEVMQIKNPTSANVHNTDLYHLYYEKAKQRNYGSYKYKGIWQLLDHILVSGLLIDPMNALHTHPNSAHVARFPFLLEKDKKYGGVQPLRTYKGMKYQEGISDHLPLYVDFELNW